MISTNEQSYAVVRQPWFDIVSTFQNRVPAACVSIWFSIRCGILLGLCAQTCSSDLRVSLLRLAVRSRRNTDMKNARERCVAVCCLPVYIHINTKAQQHYFSFLRLHAFVNSRRFSFRCHIYIHSTRIRTTYLFAERAIFYIFRFVLFLSSSLSFFTRTQAAQLHKKLSPLHRSTLSQSVKESDWVMRC